MEIRGTSMNAYEQCSSPVDHGADGTSTTELSHTLLSNTPEEGTGKRSVRRSPSYPILSLEDAIAQIRVIYEERRLPGRPDVILKHLNLTAESGSANRILSALRQYELLEDRPGGVLHVSDAAFKIIALSDGNPERAQAIRDAALKPVIVREVLKAYPDGLPFETNLHDFLVNDKAFNPDAVSFFSKVLPANLAFAHIREWAHPAVDDTKGESVLSVGAAVATGSQTRAAIAEPPAEISTPYTYPLSKNCMGIVRFRGQPTIADIERLIQFLTLSKSVFPATLSCCSH
ncbi:MAG: hypothetical protein MN733_04320 [Nitrososphaera sp.]|nr:hypothetical protein [Nitrososphaera sp.]